MRFKPLFRQWQRVPWVNQPQQRRPWTREPQIVTGTAAVSVDFTATATGRRVATTFYFRSLVADLVGVTGRVAISGQASSSATTATGTTVTGPAQRTLSSPVDPVRFYSPPLKAATITKQITFNLHMRESSTAANCGARCVIDVCDTSGNVVSASVVASSHGVEMGQPSSSISNWSVTPTPFSIADGQRLRFTPMYEDAGGTMGSGRTITLGYDSSVGANNANSYVEFFDELPPEDLFTNFEGGVDGATVDESDWNLASEYPPGSKTGTPTYTTAVVAHGSVSVSCNAALLKFPIMVVPESWSRIYLRRSGLPSSSTMVLGISDPGGSAGASVVITSTGRLAIRDSSLFPRGITTVAIPDNTWVRVELHVVHSDTVGHLEARVYHSADSTTITETIGDFATSYDTESNIATVEVGSDLAYTAWIDDIGWSAEDWLGPSFAIVTGTASVTVAVSAVAAGTVVPVGGLVTGTASVSLGFSATATGTRFAVVTGIATTSLSLSVTTTGTRVVTATAQVPIVLSITATGTVVAPSIVTGTASVSVAVAVAAVGVRVVTGTATASVAVSVTAAGTRFAVVTGTATTSLALATTATGTRVVRGTSTIPVSLAVTATGTVVAEVVAGTGAVALSLSVVATGTRVVRGTAAVQLGFSVTAGGTVVAEIVTGTATVPVSLSVTAAGTRFSVVTGTAAVTLSLTVVASGTRVVRGTAAVQVALSTTATGTRVVQGTTTVPISLTVAATGTAFSPGSGIGVVTIALSVHATGTRVVRGVAAAAVSLSVTAVGHRLHTGTSTVPIALTVTAAGAAFASGGGVGTVTVALAVTATGTRITRGTATAVVALAVTATGTVVTLVSGTATVALAVSVTAVGSVPSVVGLVWVRVGGVFAQKPFYVKVGGTFQPVAPVPV